MAEAGKKQEFFCRKQRITNARFFCISDAPTAGLLKTYYG